MDTFFQSLALFVPILAANQGPGLAQQFGLPLGATPVWVRVFGPNKTLAAYYVGPACAMVVLLLYLNPHWFIEGLVLGLGTVLGDHVKSAVKRSLGYPPGAPWFFDRIDFAIGGAVAAMWYLPWVTWEHVLTIVALAYPVHLIGNRISYNMGLRKTPH